MVCNIFYKSQATFIKLCVLYLEQICHRTVWQLLHLSSVATLPCEIFVFFFMVGICYQLSMSTVYSPIFTSFLCFVEVLNKLRLRLLFCHVNFFFKFVSCSILITEVVPPTPINAQWGGGVGKYCPYEVDSHWLTVTVRQKYSGYSSWPGIVFIV